MADSDVEPDGGSEIEADEDLFGTVSGEELTGTERVQRTLETWVVTPVRVVWSDWRARIGGLIILFYVLMGTVGVTITEPPSAASGEQLVLPFTDPNAILGTDGLGQDLLLTTIHSTPNMFKMIFAGAVFATTIAAAVGLVSGYKGGRVDQVLMTITDVMMTVPGIVLIIVVAAIFQPRNALFVGLILSIHRWAGFARALRSQVLTVREESYVEASRAMGLRTPSIISFDLLPNLAPLIAIYFMNTARGIIFASVGLYYLGVLPYTGLNWGVILQQAYSEGYALYTWDTAHWLLVPMITIITLTLGLILFAQGADRLFNPRIRARHADEADVEGDEESSRGEGIATVD